jgi:hypothetical protein
LRLARRIRETLKRKETGSIEMCERHHT